MSYVWSDMIYSYKSIHPVIAEDVFIAPSADVIGNVTIGRNSGIWFHVTIRGDVHYIRIGEETNIQDNAVLHVTNGRYPLNIGNRVTIAHNVTVHGCTIEDNSLIGMGAVILDDAVIDQYSLVAAGSLIREGNKFPPGVLIAGTPAKVIRELTEEEKNKNLIYASNYVKYKNEYLDSAIFNPIAEETHSG